MRNSSAERNKILQSHRKQWISSGSFTLIQKGRTIDPDGLNIREETY